MQEHNIINSIPVNSLVMKRLKKLKKAPVQLYYIGENPDNLINLPIVAVVGTRKISNYGKQTTEKITSELARAGVCIVSGNALGVDVTAQKAAINAGGKVICIVPSGLDKIYPATNFATIKAVLATGGSVISEYPPGHSPRPEEFLARNRLIAAISDLVLVTEGAERSGSLNTASHAKALKVPVFAVPGPINSWLSSGTNRLIKEGAKILTESKDILDFLSIEPKQKQKSIENLNAIQIKIIELINNGVSDSTLLQINSGCNTADFQVEITMLELKGLVIQNSQGNWAIS